MLRREALLTARFVVVGCASVALDLAVYTALVRTAILPPSVAKGVAYLSGMSIGFVGNKYWVFGSRRTSPQEPLMYLLLYSTTLAVNVLANGLVLSLSALPLASFLVATGMTTALNFLGLRLVTFRAGIRQQDADIIHRRTA